VDSRTAKEEGRTRGQKVYMFICSSFLTFGRLETEAKSQGTTTTTTLRLKLSAAQPREQQTRGMGSKNLSRMNKPCEKTVDSKPKIPNQIPIHVFWNYVEPFFKSIDENDLRFPG